MNESGSSIILGIKNKNKDKTFEEILNDMGVDINAHTHLDIYLVGNMTAGSGVTEFLGTEILESDVRNPQVIDIEKIKTELEIVKGQLEDVGLFAKPKIYLTSYYG